jgi:hypothetical protein
VAEPQQLPACRQACSVTALPRARCELLSAGLRPLPLLRSAPSLEGVVGVWLWHQRPRWNRCHSQSSCSSHGGVVMGLGRAPVSCLLEEGRSEPPSPLEAVWNSLVESSIMVCRGNSGLLWVELMMAVPESFLLGERLRPLK